MNILQTSSQFGIGGKAKNLLKLQAQGANVPTWTVVPQEVMLQQLPTDLNAENALAAFSQLTVPQRITKELKHFFGVNHKDKTYAVRSSAIDEDGSQFSFAGQFNTFLHVPFSEIKNKIKDIWLSAVSERVIQYRKENKLPMQFGIGVIIQEMIDADVAGVGFGADPISGDTNCQVVSAVFGLGEGLVSGELDADTYTVCGDNIESAIADKTDAFGQNKNGGIHKVALPIAQRNQACLNSHQIKEVTSLLQQLTQEMGSPQDIEFAYKDDKLFLLQTRPITTLKTQPKGEYILWDNSNIIESYPGITTPLTFSFIIKMYEMVYRQFVQIMGVKEREVNQHQDVFANTLGLVRGRVYYNLLNWYKMLAMLPGYSINAENMERMMGVKERFELEEGFQMSKGLARFRIVSMVFKMIGMQRKLPKERKLFLRQLQEVMTRYKSIDFDHLAPSKIIDHYRSFEQTLLLKWKAPLINDFFAMIWFGMLEKQVQKLCPDEANIHNNLLCGSADIISVEPIHHTIRLAAKINNIPEAKQLFAEATPKEIWEQLSTGAFPNIKKEIDEYIDKFGERCVGELKLETISHVQDPTLFVKTVKAYVNQGITQQSVSSNIEEELRSEAETTINAALKGKPLKKWWFHYILRKTRDLVSNRENLRYERTRAFGMVRNMFSALGNQWFKNGHLADPRDIFYLKLPEIKAIQDDNFPKEYASLIAKRKQTFAQYRTQEPPQERFYTYGNTFTDEYIYSLEKIEDAEEDLQGIGCCPGIVQATIQVVTDPNEIDSLNGDILVTSSTDPGWVTLFPTASAIIVERGSLLSHSAIVSREMGIPCIVSVKGLLRTVKTGDQVLMDGSTGKIKLLDHE